MVMGQRYAPSYTNIYMSKWEREALAKCSLQSAFYLRFTDDIIGAWAHGEDTFQQFVHILNTHHPSIKLKQEHSDSEINFLDTTVFFEDEKDGKRLHAKVYLKPTDTHALLHKLSYHPPHTFWEILKSQYWDFTKYTVRRWIFTMLLPYCLGVWGRGGTHALFWGRYTGRRSRAFVRLTHGHRVIFGARMIRALRKNQSLGDLLVRAKLEGREKSTTWDTEAVFGTEAHDSLHSLLIDYGEIPSKKKKKKVVYAKQVRDDICGWDWGLFESAFATTPICYPFGGVVYFSSHPL